MLKKQLIKQIAFERIIVLLNEAKAIFYKNKDLARMYVKRAWEIKLKYNLRLSRDLKFSFCKKCFTPFVNGSYSVRLLRREKCIAYICKECNHIQKICYMHEKRNNIKKHLANKNL